FNQPITKYSFFDCYAVSFILKFFLNYYEEFFLNMNILNTSLQQVANYESSDGEFIANRSKLRKKLKQKNKQGLVDDGYGTQPESNIRNFTDVTDVDSSDDALQNIRGYKSNYEYTDSEG